MRRRYTLVITLGDARLRKVLVEVPDPDYAEALNVGDCFDVALFAVLEDWAANYIEMTYPDPDMRVGWYIERERIERVTIAPALEADPRD
jgi:hypothetical protein